MSVSNFKAKQFFVGSVDTERGIVTFTETAPEISSEDKARIELLNWAMQVCTSGSTPSMIRKVFHNKLVEITGEGEKA